MAGKIEEHPIPTIVGKIDSPIPPEGQVFDFLFEVSGLEKSAFVYVYFKNTLSYLRKLIAQL